MTTRQDKFVQKPKKALDDDGTSRIVRSNRGSERLREMRDGTNLSLTERLQYAVSLVSVEGMESLGRSRKQLLRYLDGADIPFSILTELSVKSGVPVDWLAAGRPTHGPSEFDKWRDALGHESHPTSTGGISSRKREQATVINTEISDQQLPPSNFPPDQSQAGTTRQPKLFSFVDMDQLGAAIDGAQAAFAAQGKVGKGRALAQVACLLYDDSKNRITETVETVPTAATARVTTN